MLTDQHIDALRSADRALQDATFRLAMAVDYAASVLPAWHLPTDVLKALDDYREATAMMWPFFTPGEYVEPAIIEVAKAGECVVCGTLTTEYRETRDGLDWCCHEHAYQRPEPPSASTIAAVLAGPTQDQEPLYSDERETWPHVEQATPEPERYLVNGELLPERCTASGCQAPAFCKVGEFWYCDEHASDPIPF